MPTADPIDVNSPISEEMAKILGIQSEPGKPMPSMQSILAQKMAGNLKFFELMQQQTASQISEARSRIINRNKGAITDAQQGEVDTIAQILGMFPQFIQPVKITLATMVRWQKENQQLMDAYVSINPTKTLDLLGKFQEMLLAAVPKEYWPEALKKEAEASEAEVTGSAKTEAAPASA